LFGIRLSAKMHKEVKKTEKAKGKIFKVDNINNKLHTSTD